MNALCRFSVPLSRTGRIAGDITPEFAPRQDELALALREVERIERTLRILDWIELAPLRRQTAAELNKGESRHALARAVAFHRLGRLRDRTVAMLQHRASALALVTGSIALWNTVYLGRALDVLRARGEAIPDALLAHLALSGWQHNTSTLPATIFGAPTATSAQTVSDRCETWQRHHGRSPLMVMVCPVSVNPAPVLWRTPEVRLIFSAAARAQRATDYLHSLQNQAG